MHVNALHMQELAMWVVRAVKSTDKYYWSSYQVCTQMLVNGNASMHFNAVQ